MKKAFALFTTLALCAMMFASALVHGKNAAAGPQTPHAPDTYIPGEVLIQFKSGASLGDQADAKNSVGALTKRLIKKAEKAEEKAERRAARGDLELAGLQSGLSVEQAIAILKNHPAVAFAEPNWKVRHY